MHTIREKGGIHMQYGTVQVHTYASRANLPLEGTTVLLTRRDENGNDILIGRQTTDRNGNTEPVQIKAPPLSDSLSPGDRQAFSYVDITADLPRYERIVIRDVQVFPGIVSLQAIRMIPVSGLSPEAGTSEEYTVTPQPL